MGGCHQPPCSGKLLLKDYISSRGWLQLLCSYTKIQEGYFFFFPNNFRFNTVILNTALIFCPSSVTVSKYKKQLKPAQGYQESSTSEIVTAGGSASEPYVLVQSNFGLASKISQHM